jgi:hypothetical protein
MTLAVLACTGAPSASAAWSTPFDVVRMHDPVPATPSTNGFYPGVRVASSPQVTVFAWTNLEDGGHRVQARTRTTATGALGPILDITDVDDLRGLSALAAGPNGHVVLVWSTGPLGTPMHARTLVDGRLGPVVDVLSSGGIRNLDVAVDGGGNATIGWITYEKRVQLQTLRASGALGPLVTIPTPAIRSGPLALAVAASGSAVVAWDNGILPDRRLFARTASAAGRLGPVVTLWRGRHPLRAIEPLAAVSAAGDAIVAWNRNSKYDTVRPHIQSRWLSADGRLGPTVDVSRTGGEGGVQLRLAPGGRGVISWRQAPTGPTGTRRAVMRARLLSPDGTRGPLVGLSRVNSAPAIAIADSGRAVFAWGTARGVVARTVSPSSVPGPVRSLAAPGERARSEFGYSTVVIAPGEDPVVAWMQGSLARAATGP